jgi:hypothetical protein
LERIRDELNWFVIDLGRSAAQVDCLAALPPWFVNGLSPHFERAPTIACQLVGFNFRSAH